MLPDLNSLLLFLRALELGSLSKAAEHSNMAVSAASRRIFLLEKQLGVSLLLRSSSGVEATAAGKTMSMHARNVLRDIDHMRIDMIDFAKGAKGHVRVYANNSAMSQEFPSLISYFSEKFPDVKLEIREGRTHSINAAVRDGTADLGVVISGAPLIGVKYFPYRNDKLVAIVPKGHAAASMESCFFSSLLDYDHVGLDDAPTISRLLESEAARADKPLRLRVRLQSYEALCRMIQAGRGVGVLPIGAVRGYVQELGLETIALNDAWAEREMLICIREGDIPIATAKLFDFLCASPQALRMAGGQISCEKRCADNEPANRSH